MIYFFILLFTFGSAVVNSSMFPSDINVSENCQATIWKLSTLQSTHPQLMAQYWDSWGKPSDGILYGHTAFLGYYDECMDLKNTPVGKTSYCIYAVQMNITTLYNPSESQDEVCYSSDCPVPVNTSLSSNIQVGVCYPSTCSPNEFALVLSRMNIISVTNMTANPFSNATQTVTVGLTSTGDSPIFCPQTNVEYDTGTLVILAICGLLGAVVVFGTILDYIRCLFPSVSQESDKENVNTTLWNIILAFSLFKTVPTLLCTTRSSSEIRAVASLKVFANVVITAHHVSMVIFFFYPQLSQNTKQYFIKYPSRMLNQPFMNATFSVDTFFVVSATLSSYLTFKDIEKFKRFRLSYFYINRYFRLAPMFYLATFLSFKLFVHLSGGPLWYSTDFFRCQSSWWYNLLFLNNLIPPINICIIHSWHIGAEMQLFIFSPIFILMLYYGGLVGLLFMAGCVVAFTITTGVAAINNGYMVATYATSKFLINSSGCTINHSIGQTHI